MRRKKTASMVFYSGFELIYSSRGEGRESRDGILQYHSKNLFINAEDYNVFFHFHIFHFI
jgi:hypothetical protein